MARELGAISELHVAETILSSENVTLGFDATTEEGLHINSIHFTTKDSCLVAAVDELPGGTGKDYANHITQTVDNLCNTYAYFHDEDCDVQDIRKRFVSKITNTMSDRCAANGAAIKEVCEVWHKNINQLNCHLHPLDTIASSTRSTLKKLETAKGSLFGQRWECSTQSEPTPVQRWKG